MYSEMSLATPPSGQVCSSILRASPLYMELLLSGISCSCPRHTISSRTVEAGFRKPWTINCHPFCRAVEEDPSLVQSTLAMLSRALRYLFTRIEMDLLPKSHQMEVINMRQFWNPDNHWQIDFFEGSSFVRCCCSAVSVPAGSNFGPSCVEPSTTYVLF